MYAILTKLDAIEKMLAHPSEPIFRGKKTVVKRQSAERMYSLEREALDQGRSSYKVKRGTTIDSKLFWVNTVELADGMRRLIKTSDAEFIPPEERNGVRKKLLSGASVISHQAGWLDKYEIIDQGPDGACGLVGILNYYIIMGLPFKYNHLVLTRAAAFRDAWQFIWTSLDPYKTNGMFLDIASVLDALKSSESTTFPNFNYFPVRSIGNFEAKFNPMLTQGGSLQLKDETLKLNAAEGSLKIVLENIDALISGLLLQNIPVLINSNEHTTVCIGFNEEFYYFADSWGDSTKQDEFDMVESLVCRNEAGVSMVPKAFITSYVRDMAWIDPTLVNQAVRGTGGARRRGAPLSAESSTSRGRREVASARCTRGRGWST